MGFLIPLLLPNTVRERSWLFVGDGVGVYAEGAARDCGAGGIVKLEILKLNDSCNLNPEIRKFKLDVQSEFSDFGI